MHAFEWGVQAATNISDVFPGGGQRNPTSIILGGAGVPVAESILDDSVLTDFDGDGPHDRGNAHAFAGLKFAANTPPALQAEGFLTGKSSGKQFLGQFPNGAVIRGEAFASDLFQYLGATPTTLTITFDLEGIVSNTPPDTSLQTGIFARVGVLADTPDYKFQTDLDTLVFELGATLWDSDQASITGDTGGATASAPMQLSFAVSPGETFFVWERLNVTAARGTRFADAFSTLTGIFSEPNNVRSLSVPEPSLLMMVAIASATVAATRRRRSF